MKAKVIILAIIIALLPLLSLANVKLPNGVIFRVIVEDLDKQIETKGFEKYQPINFTKTDQKFTLEVGAFKDFIWAQKAKNEVKANGHQKADLVAYFNNRPVSLDDAFVLQNNMNHIDRYGKENLSEAKMDEMLSKVEKPEFFYTIQIGVFNTQQANVFFDLPKTIDERVTSKGHYRYTYGMYYTINDARAALNMLKENGMSNAFITAYDELARIPLSRAIELEEKFLTESLASK